MELQNLPDSQPHGFLRVAMGHLQQGRGGFQFYTQFLAKFPSQSILYGFPRFHLTAGELP